MLKLNVIPLTAAISFPYHQAAVGKITEEEVEYLMARGMTRDDATSTIVRGFLNVDIEGLPPLLHAELQRAVKSSEKDFM
jgi:uncharacterized protein